MWRSWSSNKQKKRTGEPVRQRLLLVPHVPGPLSQVFWYAYWLTLLVITISVLCPMSGTSGTAGRGERIGDVIAGAPASNACSRAPSSCLMFAIHASMQEFFRDLRKFGTANAANMKIIAMINSMSPNLGICFFIMFSFCCLCAEKARRN